MLTLYHNDKSTCSQKVRLCLAKELAWTDHHIDLGRSENLSAGYLAINPNGVVPALRHDHDIIIESTVICEYLDEVFESGTSLMPDRAAARAHVRAWPRYIDEVPSMAIRVPTFQTIKEQRLAAMSDEEYAEFTVRNPLRRDFFERLNKSGFSDREVVSAIKQLRQTIERMEKALSRTEWIAREDYSIADICVAPVFQRLDDLGSSGHWSGFPLVTSRYERIRQKPSYRKAFYPGSRLNEEPKEGVNEYSALAR